MRVVVLADALLHRTLAMVRHAQRALQDTYEVAMAHSEHPIITAVKAQVKDQAQPFNMSVHIRIKPEYAAAFEAEFKTCIAATRKETGCIAYDLNRSSEDATRYINYERWASVPALAAHLAEEHTVKLLATVGPFLDGSPEIKVYFFAGE